MMKIAILADIHANLAALQAVIADIEQWRPDTVIVAGDIVNRGAQSAACLDLVFQMRAERGWHVIKGNHEEYVVRYAHDRQQPDFPTSGPRHEVSRLISWTYNQVADRVSSLNELPDRFELATPHGFLKVMHASVRHNRDGILASASDDELRQQIDPTVDVFCIGHTHMPFVRRLDHTLVVNVGSVGLPFDGDIRAAYARLTAEDTNWQAEIVRLTYDLASSVREFAEGGALEAIGVKGEIMLRELQTGTSLMFDFVPRYIDRIRLGEISMDAAVHEFLTSSSA